MNPLKQTPLTHLHNEHLLGLIPTSLNTVFEVGCGSGSFAKEYKKRNSKCVYTGIELSSNYAEVARSSCDFVYSLNIEEQDDFFWSSVRNQECWVFADVLEHLIDPWKVLDRVTQALPVGGFVAISVPNVQHWSVQLSLARGAFEYQDSGLFDRTHLRWFTKSSIVHMLTSRGLNIVEFRSRLLDHPLQETALGLICSLAKNFGADEAEAREGASAFQYVILATKQ
jgi:trans-aconitate methyltransferase